MTSNACLAGVLCTLAFLGGCGSGDNASPPPGLGVEGGTGGDGGGGGGDSGSLGFGNGPTLATLTVDPPQAAIEVLNGAPASQVFTATAHFSDNTTSALSAGVTWNVTDYAVGGIDPTGLYSASGVQGGLVKVTATYNGQTGTANLTVKLHIKDNPGMVPAAGQGLLTGATTPDPAVIWAYPYDGTVFPRGLGAPPLMWNGSAAGDAYYVHLKSPTFEYESFAAAPPPATYDFDQKIWDAFVSSTTGAATLDAARLTPANVATVIAHEGWTISPASLRGTVYYWANNLGRVERIKPGAKAPDDFANQPPLNDPAKYPKQSSCLMTCHTVSADGSTLISGGGTFGGSYNLKTGLPMADMGGVWMAGENDWQNVRWMTPAISPDGQYVALNAMAPQLALNQGAPNNFEGLYKTVDGSQIPNSGLEALNLVMPAFSPDGKTIAYVNAPFPAGGSWIAPNPGPLDIVSFDTTKSPMASGAHDLVQPGADPNKSFIAWPSFSPDSRWIIYHRGVSLDTRNGNADLYLADAQNPGTEIRLGKLDGDGYPFAAGARDLSWNFEPTFEPVASGGYFWVVFTSRRTYGNALTGDKTVVKQLWVAAIDQSPQPGQDPSHAAFLLPGQDETSLNMRGFWALDPCKGEGQGCASGTECCGGYCDGSGDAGAPVCRSAPNGCSQDGDHCNLSSDCCNAPNGATCIAHVCSEATPK